MMLFLAFPLILLSAGTQQNIILLSPFSCNSETIPTLTLALIQGFQNHVIVCVDTLYVFLILVLKSQIFSDTFHVSCNFLLKDYLIYSHRQGYMESPQLLHCYFPSNHFFAVRVFHCKCFYMVRDHCHRLSARY